MSFQTSKEKKAQEQSLANLTRIEAEKKSKLNAQEEQERLDALGQPSDLKAKKFIDQEYKEAQRQQQELLEEAEFVLWPLRDKALKYNSTLVSLLIRFIKEEAIPKKYKLEAKWTKIGVVITIMGYNLQSAFASSYIPKYDIFACKMLATKLGNTVSRLEGNISQTDKGIFNPTKEEAEILLDKYNARHRN